MAIDYTPLRNSMAPVYELMLRDARAQKSEEALMARLRAEQNFKLQQEQDRRDLDNQRALGALQAIRSQ